MRRSKKHSGLCDTRWGSSSISAKIYAKDRLAEDFCVYQRNAARLAGSLGVSSHTGRHYLDVLTDLYMVRQLPPWVGNSTKRLVKTPKIYVRDTGLVHRLVNIPDHETLLGHPLCGESWEGFIIENLLAHRPDTWQATSYQTSAQAEIDLVLEGPGPNAAVPSNDRRYF